MLNIKEAKNVINEVSKTVANTLVNNFANAIKENKDFDVSKEVRNTVDTFGIKVYNDKYDKDFGNDFLCGFLINLEIRVAYDLGIMSKDYKGELNKTVFSLFVDKVADVVDYDVDNWK